MTDGSSERRKREEWRIPVKVAAMYAVIAGLWIALSDRVVDALGLDREAHLWVNILKGWFFVIVTAAGLFWLIRRYLRAIRRSDEASLLAEERFRRRYEAIDVGVTVQDTSGHIIYANDAASRILGLTHDQIIGLTSIDPAWRAIKENGEHFPGEEHPSMLTLRTGEHVHDVIMGVFHPFSGQYRWILVSAEPIIDPNRRVLQEAVSTFVDVTDRKLAEQALEEAEVKYRSLVEESLFGVYIVQDEKFTYVNPRLAEILGYTSDELLARTNAFEFVAPEDLELVRESFRKRFEGGTESAHYHARAIRKSGEIIEVEVLGSRTIYQGKVAVIGSVIDVTERRRAEQALRHSEERYRSLVESLNDWLWEVDENGLYTFASPRIRELLGYEPEEVIGKSYIDLMSPAEAMRIVGIFGTLAARREPFALLENTLVHKDGHRVVVETSGSPIFDVNGVYRGYRGIDRDITERKLAEEELRQRREAERRIREEAEEAKRRFYQTAISSVTDGKLNLVSYEEIEALVTPDAEGMSLVNADDLARLRLLVMETAENAGMPEERTRSLTSAVGEAAANALKHANGGFARVGVKDGRVQVYIRDEGPGMDALTLPKATLMKGFSTKPSMGLGYSIILASVDAVYLATERQGTRVLMEKEIVELEPRAVIDALLEAMPDNW